MKEYIEKLAPQIQKSPAQLFLLKTLSYVFYFFYLIYTNNFSITLLFLPLIFLFINPSIKNRSVLITLFLLLDFQFTFVHKNPFLKFNSLEDFINYSGNLHYVYYTPIIFLFSLGAIYLSAVLLLRLKAIRSYLSIPFFIVLFYICNQIIIATNNSYELFDFFVLGIITYLSSKIWIIYLLASELKYRSLSFLEITEGVGLPLTSFREEFSLFNYLETSHDRLVSLYLKAFLLSLVAIAGNWIIHQVSYQISSYDNALIIPNRFTLGLQCSQASYYSLANLTNMTKLEIWLCFFSTNVLQGFIRGYLLNSLIIVIPMYLMGYSFTMPFSNFLKSKSWPSFFSNLLYYYSLIVNRIFITEIYKFFLEITKKRDQYLKYIAMILGIILCGYYYHLYRDFIIVLKDNKVYILKVMFAPSVFIYFGTIALLSTFSTQSQNWSKRIIYVQSLLFVLVFVLLRALFSAYQLGISLDFRYDYFSKLFF